MNSLIRSIIFKMKQTILLLACTLLFAIHSIAQVRFGVRAGLNLAKMVGKSFEGVTPKILPSYHLGGVVEFGITPNFGIETGLLLSGKGTKIQEKTAFVDIDATATPIYLEMPINLLFKLDAGNVKFHFFGGPYLGVGAGGKFTTTFMGQTESENIKFGKTDDSNFSPLDYGLNVGWGVEIHRFIIRAQYGLGLANLDPKARTEGENANRVIGISLGYMFGGK